MPRNLSKRTAAAIAGLLAVVASSVACGINQKGMIIFTDPSYRASVIATSRDGITVADGILWKQGRFYIADEGGSAFRLWTGRGAVTTLVDGSAGIKSPEDIAADGVGNLYFTDDDAGGVWRINNFGETSRLAGPDKGLTSTEGIVMTPSGDILVGEGNSHRIYSVTPDGRVSIFLDENAGIAKAESMVYDDQGNLYIGDNESNTVYLVTPDKRVHRLIDGRADFSPETLWFSNGTLYITDSSNGKLFRYTSTDDLNVLAVFGGKLHPVGGITSDDHGNLYLSIQSDLARKVGYLVKVEHDQP